MPKIFAILLCTLLICACEKHDPILPGVRTAIFQDEQVNILNEKTPKLSGNVYTMSDTPCAYTQDSDNVIWDGTRKIFSGFPTDNSVTSNQKPVCSNGYVYAGLTTGEVVKIKPRGRQIVWIADIYRASNLTGGTPVLDIVAPIIIRDQDVFAGGLGDAFCKINATSGIKKWCTGISVATEFILIDDVAYVVSADKYLNAVRLTDGAVYWRHAVREIATPKYQDGKIIVGSEKINAQSGK